MAASKAKKLSSLFRSAVRTATSDTYADLQHFVSSLDVSSPASASVSVATRVKSESPPTNSPSSDVPLSQVRLSLNLVDFSNSNCDDSANQLCRELSPMLRATINENGSEENVLHIPWLTSTESSSVALHRKQIARQRKQNFIFKNTETSRFKKLVKMCGQKLGTDATIQVFAKLGRETGVKEFNALMGLCIEKARDADDEEVSLEEIYKAYGLFQSMKEQGFPVEEQTYGPFLMYLVDKCLVDEFRFFSGVVRDANPNSLSRLAYYEMLLLTRVKDEDEIQNLCHSVIVDDDKSKSELKENYLLALCESEHKRETLLLFENLDITRVSSVDNVATIFKSLGKLSSESLAEKFLLQLKIHDTVEETVSNCIYNYATAVPNLVVKDVIFKFKDLHKKIEVKPSSVSYENLIRFCSGLHKVHIALDLVDQMFEAGLALSINTCNSILNSCEESCEFNLVHRIYSVICCHKLKPNNETFRSMINLCVKMKDYDGAYRMLKDLEAMNLKPTATFYNTIMAGYLREKNFQDALMVRKQMKDAGINPDSHTFSYLISNAQSNNDIVEYYEELKEHGIEATKVVYMALINAYAACGQFEKAKQVVSDLKEPGSNLNEIKCALVSALASHGQMPDALRIYEEIEESGGHRNPKATFCLIEYLHLEGGELRRLLQLLDELRDHAYWVDGCYKVISYCVRRKQLSSAVGLLKQLKTKFSTDEVATEVLLDEIFCQIAESEPADLQTGLHLIQIMKAELNIYPSRRSLDFLLGACISAKDLESSFLIWKEYDTAGLPYNVLTYLRMYQALLASGDKKSATNILNKISKDDPHVRCIIKVCQEKYLRSVQKRKKQKAYNISEVDHKETA